MPDPQPMPAPVAELAGNAERPAARLLCRADQLAERGLAVGFDVLLWRQPARGFALRVDGRVVAYVNRCAHVPVEMDWQPGHFFDADQRWLICAVHGALYDAGDGRCVGGPCGRGRLLAIDVEERGGQVFWYPSADVRAPVDAAPSPADPNPSAPP